jgi:hypothetical protein
VYLRLGADRYLITPLAQELAARMFANIGISLEWKPSKPAAESSPRPIIIELTSVAPSSCEPGALGAAQPYEGSHITVFLDRIERMEYPSFVLAHVLVHEITHIVQGISRHSDTGVMKAHWTARDLCEMRRRRLPFTPVDLELIHQGLSARQAMTSAPDAAR